MKAKKYPKLMNTIKKFMKNQEEDSSPSWKTKFYRENLSIPVQLSKLLSEAEKAMDICKGKVHFEGGRIILKPKKEEIEGIETSLIIFKENGEWRAIIFLVKETYEEESNLLFAKRTVGVMSFEIKK